MINFVGAVVTFGIENMNHHCFLAFVLSVAYYVTEFQCSPVNGENNLVNDSAYSQRNVLIDQFQNALMNDTEQLFTLQKALFLPRDKCKKMYGLYLNVCVNVTVTVMAYNEYYNEYYGYCTNDFRQSNLCVISRKVVFELSPLTTTLEDFLQLQSTVQVLNLLDPSFYVTITSLSPNANYNDCTRPRNEYTIDLIIRVDSEIKLSYYDHGSHRTVHNDITDALYLTLSRVSILHSELSNNLITMIIIIIMQARTYVRNDGISIQEKLEDISWIKDVTNIYVDSMPQYTPPVLCLPSLQG